MHLAKANAAQKRLLVVSFMVSDKVQALSLTRLTDIQLMSLLTKTQFTGRTSRIIVTVIHCENPENSKRFAEQII